jgi:hypothetical protein
MREKQLHILISPGFLLCLCVLLLNDFIFKYAFPNWLTGKLSDFAGLFVFPLFWAIFFPRFKLYIHIFTAILFVLWKSAYSEPLIDYWNGLPLFSISRTIDYTDLIALTVLPFAYSYKPTFHLVAPRRALTCLVLGVSVFAFTATSAVRHKITYDQKYYFQESWEELFERINRQQLVGYTVGQPPTCCPNDPIPERYTLPVRGFCGEFGADATIVFGRENSMSVIMLSEINYECPKGESDKRELQQIFERDFISKIR